MRPTSRALLSLAAVIIAFGAAGCTSEDSGTAGRSAAGSDTAAASTSAAAGSAQGAPASAGVPGPAVPTSGPWALDFRDSGSRIRAAGLEVLTAEGTAEHYHAHLDIFVNGSPQPVPANIGFAVDTAGNATGISALHTHDASGVLHVEAPSPGLKYTLGQVLTEWGVLASDGSIGGKTDAGSAAWHAYVNGTPQQGKATDVQLAAHQEIALVYGTDPAPVPSSYAFPAGE